MLPDFKASPFINYRGEKMEQEIKRQELKAEILRLTTLSLARILDQTLEEEREAGGDPMELLETILREEQAAASEGESAIGSHDKEVQH
jgi:hypothetical protein